MPARHQRRSRSGRRLLGRLLGALAVAAGPALAAEGQREIAQSLMPLTITAPGLYAVTENLTGVAGSHGITIAASDVTLDLNGFSLQGVPGSASGIALLEPGTNLTVRNGTIAGWGGDGIDAVLASNSTYVALTLGRNGTNGMNGGFNCNVAGCTALQNLNVGIEVENGSTVERCVAYGNSQHGLALHSGSTARDCTLITNGHDGIHGSFSVTVVGCVSRDSQAGGDGIEVDAGSVVRDCVVLRNEDGIKLRGGAGLVVNCIATSNRDDGIDVDADCSVLRSVAAYNAKHGVRLTDRSTARDNTASANGRSGVKASGSGNVLAGNTVSENLYGVLLDTDRNIVIGNTASGNTSDYVIPAGNEFQKVSVTGGVLPDSPWVNLSY